MEKKVLTEVGLYYGDISMPKGFEIDQDKFLNDILQSSLTNKEFPFSKNWDMLNTYMLDYTRLEYGITLVNKQTWGNTYKPNELSDPLIQVDHVDLKNSPDFVMLYGVKLENCWVKIYYDDNRRKGRSWDIPLKNNKFIMFPSTCMYNIHNEQKDSLNFIQTITYDYV